MANFEYPFTSSLDPASYPLDADGAAGITVIDEVDDARVLKSQRIGAGVYLLTIDASDAVVTAAVQAYADGRGATRAEAGGAPTQPDARTTMAGSAVGAAD